MSSSSSSDLRQPSKKKNTGVASAINVRKSPRKSPVRPVPPKSTIASDLESASAEEDAETIREEIPSSATPPEWQNIAPNCILKKMKELNEEYKGQNKKEFYKSSQYSHI